MDVNVYDDIYDFDLGEEIEKLKAENRMLDEHIQSLQADIEKLTATIMKLKENQDNLTKNISSLYLTAKAEIDRKDRMIADLRIQLDNMYFRRHNVNIEPKRKEIELNNVNIEPKRKQTEDSTLDMNEAKRFKHDLDDRSHNRSKSQTRYSSERYSNRSRSGSRERVNKYVGDRGRRYNDRDRWNDDRDKRINDRVKWEVRDKRDNGAQSREDKYMGSRYSGYDRRKPFERQYHPRRETPPLHSKDNPDYRPEARQEKDDYRRFDATDKIEEKVTTNETEKVSAFEGTRSISHTSVSENKDVPKNKPVKKRLKMLDEMEEKIRKKRSTPVKAASDNFKQSKKTPLRKLMDELDKDYQVISDITTEDSKSSSDRLSNTSIDKNVRFGKREKLKSQKCRSAAENRSKIRNKELKGDTQSDRTIAKINDFPKFPNTSKDFPDNSSGKSDIRFERDDTKRNTESFQSQEEPTEDHSQTDKNSFTDVSTSATIAEVYSRQREEKEISLGKTVNKKVESNENLERKGYSKYCNKNNKSSDAEFLMLQKEKIMQSLPKDLSVSHDEINRKETEQTKNELMQATKSDKCTREEKTQPPKMTTTEEVGKSKDSSKEKQFVDSSKVDGRVNKEIQTKATDASLLTGNEKCHLVVNVENLDLISKENIIERNKRRSMTPAKEPKEESGKENITERNKKRSKTPARELQKTKEPKEESEKEDRAERNNKRCKTPAKQLQKSKELEELDNKKQQKETSKNEEVSDNILPSTKKTKRKEGNKDETVSRTEDGDSTVKGDERKSFKKSAKDISKETLEKEVDSKRDTKCDVEVPPETEQKKHKEGDKTDDSSTEDKILKGDRRSPRPTKESKTEDVSTETKDSETVGKNLEEDMGKSSTRDVTRVEKNETDPEIELHLNDNVDITNEHKNGKHELIMTVDIWNSMRKDLGKGNNILEDKSSRPASKEKTIKKGVCSKFQLLFGDEESKHKDEVDACSSEAKNSLTEEIKRILQSSTKDCSKEKMERRKSTSMRDTLVKGNKNKDVTKTEEVEMEIDICDPEVKDSTKISDTKDSTKISISSDKNMQKPKAGKRIARRSSKVEIQKEPLELHVTDEVTEDRKDEKHSSEDHGNVGNFERNNEKSKLVGGNNDAKSSSEETVESKVMKYNDMGDILRQTITSDKMSKTKTKSKEGIKPEENLFSKREKSKSVPKKNPIKRPKVKSSNTETEESVKQASFHKKLDALIENCLVTSYNMAASGSKETAPEDEQTEMKPVDKSAKQTPATVEATKTSLPVSSPMNNTQDVTSGKSAPRRRITPTPVKDDKPICSFENILEKSRSPSFSNTTPLHLTHDGEIPVLHLEDNHINNLPTESNINDKNIMNLLDTMSISNIESDMAKFKSIAETSANTHNIDLNLSPIKGDVLTFENVIRKATSTPEVPNNKSIDKDSDVRSRSILLAAQSSAVGGDARNSTDNKMASTSLPTLTTPIRRRRRCRLVIRD